MQDTIWTIRAPNKNDIPFIYATWLNSFYLDSWAKSITKTIFFENYKRVVDHILQSATVTIACSQEDPNVIFGYLVSEPGVAHYCFVKEAFRSFGIAKDLYNKAFDSDEKIQITHRTRKLNPIFNKKQSLIFNPLILFTKE